MNLNLFDGSMIVQNILEKAVKRMYLVVRIVKKINYMERNISQILNITIMVIVFITFIPVVTNEILGLGVFNLSVKLTKL